MPTLTSSTQPILDAMKIAAERGVLPTTMGSADLAKLGSGLWRQSFFSARLSSAEAASAFKELIDRYVAGGYNSDLGQLRVEARAMLQKFGYTPTLGFPESFGEVPEAEEGSLQDLTSEKRLNLIFETNARLARGLTQKLQGLSRINAFPAWELARLYYRRVPRGSVAQGSPGWEKRWVQCGGRLINDRMIALKSDPIWAAIGSRANFPDALDVDHPPFAFNSGFGWKRELDREECVALGLLKEHERILAPSAPEAAPERATLPKTLDPQAKLALLRELRATGRKFSESELRDAIRAKLNVTSASNDSAIPDAAARHILGLLTTLCTAR